MSKTQSDSISSLFKCEKLTVKSSKVIVFSSTANSLINGPVDLMIIPVHFGENPCLSIINIELPKDDNPTNSSKYERRK